MNSVCHVHAKFISLDWETNSVCIQSSAPMHVARGKVHSATEGAKKLKPRKWIEWE